MNDGVTGSGEKRPEASGRKTPYLVFLLLLTLFVLASVLPFPANQGRADTAYDAEELEFLDRINAYRAENGLGELVLSDDLTVAAERHNRDMGGFRFFAHDTAQSFYYAPGSEPWDRMAAEGYSYNAFKGENLAAGYETADEAFAAWKASPSHNSAMLDGNYKVVGVSRLEVPGSPFGWYWTTDFGSFVDPSARTEAPVRSTEVGERRDRPSENTVRNGSFVGAEFWEQSAKDEAKLILRGQFVRMGGYDNGADEVRQGIKVRPDAVLRYDFKVSSVGDGDPEDSLTVRLTDNRGRPVAALKRYNGGQETDWKRQRVDLSDYAGQDLYLSFVSRTDAERDSYFYLDDVSITP